jgi:lipase chaperone LimK
MMQEDPLWVTEEINNLRHFHLGKDVSDIFFYQQQALRDQRQGSQTELPLNLQQQQANTLRLTNLQKQTQQLISTGADTEMIQRMRNEHLGQEAADRLAILDNNRHIWQTKRQNYQALKAQWNDVSGLSVSDKTQAFEQYAREKLALNKQELKRMQALDRIQAHAKL